MAFHQPDIQKAIGMKVGVVIIECGESYRKPGQITVQVIQKRTSLSCVAVGTAGVLGARNL